MFLNRKSNKIINKKDSISPADPDILDETIKAPERISSPEIIINPQEQYIKNIIIDELYNTIDLSLLESLPEEEAHNQISEMSALFLLEKDVPLNAEGRKRVIEEIGDEILGLGPLEPLLKDKSISDILVNSFSQIYVERKGKLEPANSTFRDNQHLLNVIDRIVSQVGRRVDESSPMVDARLKDGSRVNAIILRLLSMALPYLYVNLRLKSSK